MKLMNTNWNFPTSIWFGAGRIHLPVSCQKSGIRNPLLVTDTGLVELDIVENTERILKQGGIDFTIYSGGKGRIIQFIA